MNSMDIDSPLGNKILLTILKDFSKKHTITSLSKELKITRTGIWKILKRLESREFITLQSLGSGKTSIYMVEIMWGVLTEKVLSLYLTEESLGQIRWRKNFEELEKESDFLIIYGSILNSKDKANDIDLVSIEPKNKFLITQKIINKIQKTQLKKVHDIHFTKEEFKQELKESNKAFIEAVKKGVILFGQEKFVQLMKEVIQNE